MSMINKAVSLMPLELNVLLTSLVVWCSSKKCFVDTQMKQMVELKNLSLTQKGKNLHIHDQSGNIISYLSFMLQILVIYKNTKNAVVNVGFRPSVPKYLIQKSEN